MKKQKICVYAICKNEEKFVDTWVESMKEADIIIVTDTGSTDKTVEKLREKGVIVHEETISPWRFDEARNKSLSHVPEDIDICVCTDLDEVFEPGWRKHLEKSWKKGTKTGNYLYNWSLKEDGTPYIQFHYFKIHSRKDFKWAYPIHECLRYTGTEPEKKVFLPGVILNHFPDSTKSRSSYLPLLELAVKEEPWDSRMNYYLGREYMYTRQWRKCIHTLEKYLLLPTSLWNEERCAAMRWIAQSHRQLNEVEESYKWYHRAIAENMKNRDAYIEFAKLAYQQSNWNLLAFLTQEALKINSKSPSFVNMGYSWDETPYDLASIACFHLKMYESAFTYASKAAEIAPDNERIQKNVELLAKY